MAEIDLHRAQVMRQQINRILRGKSIHDIVGALQMVTVDVVEAMPRATVELQLSAARAIAADIENIIRERDDRGRPN